MSFSLRHVLLVAGILCVIFSFLFFGREQDIYSVLLASGLFLSGISFLAVIIKDKGKSRLIWFGVVVAAIGILQLSQAWIIGKSFQILITRHQSLFDQANTIMLRKPNDLTFWSYDHKDSPANFNAHERQVLESLKRKAGLTYISKTSTRIFYETYGFLDVRGGVSYFYKDSADNRFYKIKGRWYY